MASGHLNRGTVSKPSKIIQSKKQIIAEYKLRLKNNINSLNQNFKHILTALKVIFIVDFNTQKVEATTQ